MRPSIYPRSTYEMSEERRRHLKTPNCGSRSCFSQIAGGSSTSEGLAPEPSTILTYELRRGAGCEVVATSRTLASPSPYSSYSRTRVQYSPIAVLAILCTRAEPGAHCTNDKMLFTHVHGSNVLTRKHHRRSVYRSRPRTTP